MEGRVELLDEVKAGDVPRRCRPGDASLTTVDVDLLILLETELEAFLLRSLVRAPRTLTWGVECFSAGRSIQGTVIV